MKAEIDPKALLDKLSETQKAIETLRELIRAAKEQCKTDEEFRSKVEKLYEKKKSPTPASGIL